MHYGLEYMGFSEAQVVDPVKFASELSRKDHMVHSAAAARQVCSNWDV